MNENIDIAEPIYRTKDGQIVTQTQLVKSGYDNDRITKGVTNGILSKVGDTNNADQMYKTKDGQTVSTKQLLSSGYSQERIDNGIYNGVMTPHFKDDVKKKGKSILQILWTMAHQMRLLVQRIFRKIIH